MNISGPQYSSATVGLRQPGQILDQQFKLVYIYPMLCDSSLTKYKELLRTFISVSMLKEIYTSNSINFFTMGSNIGSLVDNQGNVVDIDSHVMSNLENSRGFGFDNPLKTKHEIQQNVKYDIQEKIKERSVYIKKILNVDPTLKQFKPYLEMITMNNFIDIPVIVGTKCLDINKIVMLMVLTVAVADKQIKMTSYTDIERIFRIIKNTPNNDLNSILNHLIDVPTKDETIREKILSFFITDRTNTSKVRRSINTFLLKRQSNIEARRTNQPKTKSILNRSQLSPILNSQENQLDALSNVSKNDVSQAQIFFKLSMDPEAMVNQFGYKPSRGQLKETFTRINPQINSVFESANEMFANSIWPFYISPVLSSFLYTIVPRDSGIDVSDIIIALQNGNNNLKIKGIFGPILQYITNDFKKELNNTIEKQGPEKADDTLNKLKLMCITNFPESSKELKEIQDSIKDKTLDGPDYKIGDHIDYEKTFEDIISKIAPQMHNIESKFKQILPNTLIDDLLLKRTASVINDGLNSVITYFNTFQNYPNSTAFFGYEQNRNQEDTQISSYISSSKKQIIFYIRYYILYIIQYILCKYIDETKVAVETTKHDVIDTNNYSLVLPLETVLLLANAYASKSYRNLYNQATKERKEDERSLNTMDMNLVRDLSQNYVKGIIKFMHKQLDVPNLFVIDEDKQYVYYKLMYQSNVNKIKLNTIQTYSDNILNTYSGN